MSKEKVEPKIGSGHAEAMLRQGLSELRGALYNESNCAQPPQYGLYGTRTPGEVAKDREGQELDRNEEPPSHLEERLKQAEQDRSERAPEQPGHERE